MILRKTNKQNSSIVSSSSSCLSSCSEINYGLENKIKWMLFLNVFWSEWFVTATERKLDTYIKRWFEIGLYNLPVFQLRPSFLKFNLLIIGKKIILPFSRTAIIYFFKKIYAWQVFIIYYMTNRGILCWLALCQVDTSCSH